MISKKDLKKLQELLEETDYGVNTIYLILKGKIPKKMIEAHKNEFDKIKNHTLQVGSHATTLQERVNVDQAMVITPSAVTYESIKEWILSGLNINDICAGANEEAKKKTIKMFKEMQIVAEHSKRDFNGNIQPDEELVELLKLVQRDPKSIVKRVKDEIPYSRNMFSGKN